MTTLRFWAGCPVALLAVAGVSSAWGQALSDPTRPAITTEEVAGVHLLLVTPTRKYALIGGELLAPGQTGSQGKLLEIRPNEVVMQTENGRETLSLSPGVVKRPAQPLVTGAKARPATINIGNNK